MLPDMILWLGEHISNKQHFNDKTQNMQMFDYRSAYRQTDLKRAQFVEQFIIIYTSNTYMSMAQYYNGVFICGRIKQAITT